MVEGNEISIRQGAALQVNADKIDMKAAGIGLARSQTMEVSTSNAGVLLAGDTAHLDLSSSQLVVSGGSVTMEQSASVGVVGKDISLRDSAVVFLVAKNVSGEVTTIFGPREAVIFGAVAGMVGSAVMLAARILRKR